MKGFISKQLLVVVLLVTSIFISPAHAQSINMFAGPAGAAAGENLTQEAFVRTELYFGTGRSDLPPVTHEEWRSFLDSVITRRFPEGLTVLTADGQFQDDEGNVVKEKSFVLILLYPLEECNKKSESIEFIRKAYKHAFGQQSVLRVDYTLPVKVSF